MDSILTVIGIIFFVSFFYQVPQLLKKIAQHLYRIKLLLEFQNPAYDSDDLWQFDQVIKYWDDIHEKYDGDYSKESEKLRDLVFNRWLLQYRLRNLMHQNYFQALKHNGDLDKIEEVFDKEINKVNEDIRKLEEKISALNPKIKEILEKKSLGMEFGHRWKYQED